MATWAVNYATQLDWEYLRDDGGHDLDQLSSVTCLPQLYATKEAALDAGEKAWRAETEEIWANSFELDGENDPATLTEYQQERDRVAKLRVDHSGDGYSRSFYDGEDIEVLIQARELTLP